MNGLPLDHDEPDDAQADSTLRLAHVLDAATLASLLPRRQAGQEVFRWFPEPEGEAS